ncbi:MAG: Na/Pi cotransporter family protein [Clostridia bacterium]|nr:Na/Pi cotransporter family protein [Clostridia bacterium]
MELANILMALGGLGMFLYGMKMMSDGLERVAGGKLKTLFEKITKNKIIGVLIGALFTAIIQSSSATTVMVVGFVNAGLMDLFQAVPIILGANIGTTITSGIIALDIMEYAPILIVIGVICSMSKKKRMSQIAEVVFGFGILFVGLSLLGDNLKPLAEIEGFQKFMIGMSNPILAIIAGAIFTAAVQSSSASIGILQVFAAGGLVGLDSAVYILMGMNIGTCITALISSINTKKNARRTAIMHLSMKVMDTAIFGILIQFIPLVSIVKNAFANNPMMQIAAMHTIFNVFGTIIFLPFTKYIVKLSTLIVPGEDKNSELMSLHFIDERILSTPNIAVGQLAKEIDRMGCLAIENLTCAVEAFTNKDESKIEEIEDREAAINFLEHEITTYLVKLNQYQLSEHETIIVSGFYHVVNDIERVGDHAININDYLKLIIERNSQLTEDGVAEIREMYESVKAILELAMEAFRTRDPALLEGIYPLEQKIDEMEKVLANGHIERLKKNHCTPRMGMIFTDLASNLERVGDHATNIANSIVD